MVGNRARVAIPAISLALLYAGPAIAQDLGQPADPRRTPGIWGSVDPKHAQFLAANCRHPAATIPPGSAPSAPIAAASGTAPSGAAVTPGPPSARSGAPPARPASPPVFEDLAAREIPGVIAGGRHWKVVWEGPGNADGIVAFDDGSVWIAQEDKSQVVRVDKDGKGSVIYTDTYTGSALAANSKGQVFVAERALGNAVWMLRPQRRLFTDTLNGEPLDCAGRFINDIVADGKGGLYMTMDGVYYANSKGVVTGPFGTIAGSGVQLTPNGLMLSPDERTFYATGRVTGTAGGIYNAGLIAYDVQPDGSLRNERQVAEICGDGLAVDAAGRIYCTLSRMPDPDDPSKTVAGIGVVSAAGQVLGMIPQPRPLDSVAFGGPDKGTLFAVASRPTQLLSIQMIAHGNRKRPK